MSKKNDSPEKKPVKSVSTTATVSRSSLPALVGVGLVTFIVGFLVSYLNPQIALPYISASRQNGIDLNRLYQVRSILNAKFDGSVDQQAESDGAISGLVASLGDPYTTYLDAKANDELNSDLAGTLSGIGVEVGIQNNHITVITPIDDTPAAKAGLRTGDIIATIDGTDTSGMSIDTAVTKIRGAKGTTVKLGIVRGNDPVKEYVITRDDITVPSVKVDVKDGIGTLRIRRFGDDTASLVADGVHTFKNSGVKGVIIDVRGNPGGYLQAAVDVASEFIKSGTVVEERSSKSSSQKMSASGTGELTDIPIVMLIDGGSASAAEILAGALHDNNRATLVGEKSYGKGSVQEIVQLGSGTSLKVTVAHWYTPDGVNIGKEGIKPDVEVKNSDDDISAGRDPQLDKALDLLRQKIQ